MYLDQEDTAWVPLELRIETWGEWVRNSCISIWICSYLYFFKIYNLYSLLNILYLYSRLTAATVPSRRPQTTTPCAPSCRRSAPPCSNTCSVSLSTDASAPHPPANNRKHPCETSVWNVTRNIGVKRDDVESRVRKNIGLYFFKLFIFSCLRFWSWSLCIMMVCYCDEVVSSLICYLCMQSCYHILLYLLFIFVLYISLCTSLLIVTLI